MKVAILGAGGFVGSAVYRHLLDQDDLEPIPIVRRLGSAWPLLRMQAPLVVADAGQPDVLGPALAGCEAVVNCALGPSHTLPQQMQAILVALKRQGVRRFVHLSSVTVYGDRPSPAAVTETAPEKARPRTYGWYKARQDLLIQRASQRTGLQANILCLPQVTGPRSRFLTSVVDGVARGTLLPLTGGPYICSVVDVADVSRAVRLALTRPQDDARRTFVCNDDAYTWDQLLASAAQLTGRELPLPARDPRHVRELPKSLRASIRRVLLHPEIRRELKAAGLGRWTLVRWLKPWLRRGSRPTPPAGDAPNLDELLMRQQLRNVAHSPRKAETTWGWTPEVSSTESFQRFAAQYRRDRGMDGEFADLYRHLLPLAEA